MNRECFTITIEYLHASESAVLKRERVGTQKLSTDCFLVLCAVLSVGTSDAKFSIEWKWNLKR
jgi:hypothetical protein